MKATSLLSSVGCSLTMLLICTHTTALRFDLFLRDFQTLFRRGLPGSLAVAPQGAVDDSQPPGPVTYNPLSSPTWPVAATMATTTTPTAAGDASRRAFEDAMQTGDMPANSPRKNVAIVTGTVTRTEAVMAATQTATASRDSNSIIASTGLMFAVLLAAALL